jgi:murein DD-endopeptidase MepM/ murein hydrolase activator NlpD
LNRYLCKCGRAANKSTNADNTGNRETEGCEGCPYLMPWGEKKYNHDTKHFYLDIKGYECRMSPTLEYETRFGGSVTDRCTCYIASLDFDFLERVSAWIKEHYPDGQISGTFSRETIRAVEYVSNGRYRLSISCAQNKAGIAAKAALFNAFFDESGRRFDMDADAEKAKILRDIERGKAAAHSVAAAPDKEETAMTIYKDPATGWLYRVSPQPGQDDCFCIEYLDPASSAAWKFWPAEAKTRATSRKTIVEVFEARAKQNGWELVSDTNGCAPGLPEICRGCLCWKCGNVDCDLICDHNDREVHECGNFGSIGMGESCEYYIPKKEEYEPCQNQPAPNGDAAATTAGNAVPEPAETSTTPTDANTLPAPGCPADAGSATQSLSAAGPASLEAEPEATPFDYSGLDAQTVATLHSAENIIRSARKEYVIKVADAVGMAHDELVRNSDGHNQYSEDTFIAWCKFVGISKSTAYQLLQVSNLLESSTPNEQKILKQASPSLLYAAARPSAEPEAVAALKGGDITTHKQYRALEAQLKAEREAREKAAAEAERLRYANDALRDEAATARAQAKHAQEKADALETRPVMSELFDAKERIKELEARPVEVAVQEPDPAEVERRAGEKAREMTSMLQAQVRGMQEDLDDARKIIDSAESATYMVAAEFAVNAAQVLNGIRASFWAVAKELSDEDFSSAAAPLLEAANRIVDCEWDDDEEEQE